MIKLVAATGATARVTKTTVDQQMELSIRNRMPIYHHPQTHRRSQKLFRRSRPLQG